MSSLDGVVCDCCKRKFFFPCPEDWWEVTISGADCHVCFDCVKAGIYWRWPEEDEIENPDKDVGNVPPLFFRIGNADKDPYYKEMMDVCEGPE